MSWLAVCGIEGASELVPSRCYNQGSFSVACVQGEVTEMTPMEQEAGGNYGKVISHVVIGLKTTKGTKQLKLDPMIYDALQKEKVAPGDVIYIEASSGAVKRVGRCDAFATEVRRGGGR